MTAYEQRPWGSSMPATRPGAPRQATYVGAWKDLLAILAIAVVVSAALIGGMALGRTATPLAATHHGGAHGRAGILFKMRQGAAVRADSSAARTTQTPYLTGSRPAVPSPDAGAPPFTRFG
jgi:hypothetical protein